MPEKIPEKVKIKANKRMIQKIKKPLFNTHKVENYDSKLGVVKLKQKINIASTKLKDPDILPFQMRKSRQRNGKLTQNPGINMLELGKVHFYLNSHFNFYRYNLSTIKNEYNKIFKHKNEILDHISKHKNLTNELKTYVNILQFNCEQLTNKIKIIASHKNKRGIIDGLGTIVKTITGNLDANDGRRYDELFDKINKNINILQIQNLDII